MYAVNPADQSSVNESLKSEESGDVIAIFHFYFGFHLTENDEIVRFCHRSGNLFPRS